MPLNGAMRSALAPLCALAAAAALAALVALLAPSVVASPYLTALDGRAVVRSSNGTAFTLELLLPPYAHVSGLRLACVANASRVEARASGGRVEVRREGDLLCLYVEASNPAQGFKSVVVEVAAAPPPPEGAPPLIAAAIAAAAVAAASYLSLSERGRGALLKAASIPVAYAIVSRERALANSRRRAIYEYIRRNPGVGPRQISRELGISFGEVQWHLSVLERVGLVARVTVGRRALYYPADMQLHEWLPQFALRELGLRIDPDALRRAEPRVRSLLAAGCTVEELKAALAGLN